MCMTCWEREGSQWADNPLVRATAAAINKVYDYECVGGHLHIVVDDWNLEDRCLDSCDEDLDKDDGKSSPESLEAQRYCLGLMRSLSIAERHTAMVIREGHRTLEAAINWRGS